MTRRKSIKQKLPKKKIHNQHLKTLKKRKKKNPNKLNPLQCSPKMNPNDFTCYSNEALLKLKGLWNARHPDAEIKSTEPKEIWDALHINIGGVCKKESCWLKQNFMNNKVAKELKESFAPVSPSTWKKNPNEWLSSVDILDVMRQYEKAYKCFLFLGPSPIDFDTHMMNGTCVWEELCNFNLQKEVDSGKFKFGVIFNLDPHYKRGSHWVSLFINTKKKNIFYFDSVGNKIPDQIIKFVDKVIEQGKQIKPKPIYFNFDQNYPVEHQYKNTECGVYSIFFISHMLEDKVTEKYLKTHILKDAYIEKFRKIYFNENPL